MSVLLGVGVRDTVLVGVTLGVVVRDAVLLIVPVLLDDDVVDAVRVVVNVVLLVDDPVIVTDGVGDGGASA